MWRGRKNGWEGPATTLFHSTFHHFSFGFPISSFVNAFPNNHAFGLCGLSSSSRFQSTGFLLLRSLYSLAGYYLCIVFFPTSIIHHVLQTEVRWGTRRRRWRQTHCWLQTQWFQARALWQAFFCHHLLTNKQQQQQRH